LLTTWFPVSGDFDAEEMHQATNARPGFSEKPVGHSWRAKTHKMEKNVWHNKHTRLITSLALTHVKFIHEVARSSFYLVSRARPTRALGQAMTDRGGVCKVARAGGLVCIGSRSQMQGIGYHWEMWALASGGWKPIEVLRAATLHGAEAIGYAQDLGSLEPGKLADLVILNKDPLQDIQNSNSVRFVMKNGKLFEGDTLDRTWPDAEPLPPLWWWGDKPAK
jgi:hypothetical protein